MVKTMIEKALSLEIFLVLDSIAKKYRIIDKEWSFHSKLPRPRISEIRSLARGKRPPKDVDRIFSVSKCSALILGLINIIGGDIMRKEMKEATKKLKTIREIACLLVLNLPEEKLRDLIRIIDDDLASESKQKKNQRPKKGE